MVGKGLAKDLYRAPELAVSIEFATDAMVGILEFFGREELFRVDEVLTRPVIGLVVAKGHLDDRLLMIGSHGIGEAAEHPDKIRGPFRIGRIDVLPEHLRGGLDDEMGAVAPAGKAEGRDVGIDLLRVKIELIQIVHDTPGLLLRDAALEALQVPAEDSDEILEILTGG